MSPKQKALCCILAVLLVIGMLPHVPAQIVSAAVDIGAVGRGFTVTTCIETGDFPLRNPLVQLSAGEQLEEIVRLAVDQNYKTVYFEAVNYSRAMYKSTLLPLSDTLKEEDGSVRIDNPLKDLADLCDVAGIGLVAVVNPLLIGPDADDKRIFAAKDEEYFITSPDGVRYYDPTVPKVQEYILRMIEELIRRYEVDAIQLAGFYLEPDVQGQAQGNVSAALTAILQDICELRDSYAPELAIGVETAYPSGEFLGSGAAGGTDIPNWAMDGLADYIVCTGECFDGMNDTEYAAELSYWNGLTAGLDIGLLTMLPYAELFAATEREDRSTSRQDLLFRQYINQRDGKVPEIVQCYSTLRDDEQGTATEIFAQHESGYDAALESALKFPQTLAITRPYQDSMSWTGEKFFIMGTSDPTQELYFRGNEVERFGTKGAFGLLVDVAIGTNTYTFTQGERAVTATIIRPDPYSTVDSTINAIQKSSVFPGYDQGIRAGEEIELACIAPSGGYVSARVGGVTVQLRQVAATERYGIAAWYKATYTIPAGNYNRGEVTDIGSITYSLSYGGTSSSVDSEGKLSVVGSDADFIVAVKDYFASYYEQSEDEDEERGPLAGITTYDASDYVEAVQGDFYLLRSGYLIYKNTTEVLTDAKIENSADSARLESDGRGESLILSGTAAPFFHGEMAGDTLTVTLYNTEFSGVIDISESELFGDVSLRENAGNLTLTFSLRDGKKLWGYDVRFDGTNTVIYARKPPVLSGDPAKPLEGIVIVLDAGHGSDAEGALGTAGTSGPMEAQLNYTNALQVQKRMQQLGATVIIANQDGKWLDYEERMDPARQYRADFFISIHHNSTAESFDSHNRSGVEAYYFSDWSEDFARTVTEKISAGLRRGNNGYYQSTYHVTKMTYAPSILVELGYLPNPAEYEQVCDPFVIYKTAFCISDAIEETVRTFS